MLGYSRLLGSCSILNAELSRVFEGLTMVWSLGVHRLGVDCDNAMEVQQTTIKQGCINRLRLLRDIKSMCGRLREVSFKYIYNAANQLVDGM
ncbi:hypothetical protein PVK06_027562 [Gossypium arboreum]|uniref:RNase H type-1 domain-containing protein n=1 Tax=Gossypium arboreum TaxID=29729 RepID=A0ABR0P0M6_GOSAR|nr:hypothetical protein PVK06_027562 [Gossypium arboreum]